MKLEIPEWLSDMDMPTLRNLAESYKESGLTFGELFSPSPIVDGIVDMPFPGIPNGSTVEDINELTEL